MSEAEAFEKWVQRNRRFRRTRAFLADRRGATAIEFGMIIVPFLGILAAIFETGAVYFRSAQLQMVTETASRSILTNSATAGMTYKQFIQDKICTWQTGAQKPGTLGKMFDCSLITADIQAVTTWGSANMTKLSGDQNLTINLPPPGGIAVVRVYYPAPRVFNVLGGSALSGFSVINSGVTKQTISGAESWRYSLTGTAAFRVEPGT